MSRHTLAGLAVIALALSACSDSVAPTAAGKTPLLNESEGRGVFQRYVAIGTSISMGFASDGVIAADQENSWPAQLGRLAGREITQPYIDGTGCRSPLRAPLASGRRVSGEAAGANAATLSCAELRPDVTLPVQNTAIAAALTKDVLYTTRENITDANYTALYSRVLLPGMTQLTTMMTQNPKFVSVELGGNEVLNSRSGVAIPGITMFPVSAWKPLYDQVLDSVQSVTKMAVVTGLIADAGTFPGFRRGDELWADRATFAAAFNVTVSPDCAGSPNLLFVPVRVPVAVATGAAYRQRGLGPYTLFCSGAGPTTQDYVLTPAEVAVVNAQLAEMTAHIRSEAERRDLAYFDLDALYGRSDLKPTYSVLAQMTSATPYGQYISLDGIHPNALGSTVLADAAAQAINARYDLGIPSSAGASVFASRR